MTNENNDTLPGTYTPDENVTNVLENIASSPYGSFTANPSQKGVNKASGHVKKRSKQRRNGAVKILKANNVKHGIYKCGKPIRKKNGRYEEQSVHLVDPEVKKNGMMGGKGAKLFGAQQCKSNNGCPVCSERYAYEQSQQALRAAKLAIALGITLLFMTMTIPHTRNDSLADERKILSKVRSYVKGHRKWKETLAKYGYIGSILAVDITVSRLNGWHAHCHEVPFFNGVLDEDAIAEIQSVLFELWDRGLERYGWYENNKHKRLDPIRIQVELPGDNEKVAGYVTKSVGGSLIGAVNDVVYSAGGTKQAASGHYMPFDLIDLAIEQNDKWAERKFCEYVDATRGWHRIQWTKGLDAKLGLKEEEHTQVPAAYLNTRDYVEILDKRPDALEHAMFYAMDGDWNKFAEQLGCVGYARRKAYSVTIGSNGYTIGEAIFDKYLSRDDPHKFENMGYDPLDYEELFEHEFNDPDVYVESINDVGVLALVKARPDEKPGTIYGNPRIIGRKNVRPKNVKLVHCYEHREKTSVLYSSPLPVTGAYADEKNARYRYATTAYKDNFDGQAMYSTCCTVDKVLVDDPDCVPYRDKWSANS